MANQLRMAVQQAILVLGARGWSQRRIARELGVHRETVARYLKISRGDSAKADSGGGGPSGSTGASSDDRPERALPTEGGPAKPAISTAGSRPPPDAENGDFRPTKAVSGVDSLPEAGPPTGVVLPKPAISTAGLAGRRSLCEPYRAVIIEGLERGLSAQRIWQDLRSEHGFAGSYESVKRFTRGLRTATPLPPRRMECTPGREVQVDFGTGIPICGPDGKRRRTYVFRMVLSHSRKGYSEVVHRQTAETFLRCLENAFRHFGGVTETVVIDNLKAGVITPDWYDPDLNPKLMSFAEHYGTVILPTKSRMPRHKGKVERGVGYVKSNALKGRTFASLAEQNEHLRDWEMNIADTRIHGTTRRQVSQVFQQVERPTLLPLPEQRFPLFQEGRRSVHRDAHVEVDKSYYSVPPEYVRRQVWVRWDERLVRIFNQQMEQIAVHARRPQGTFSTQRQHIDNRKISKVEHGAAELLRQANSIGPNTGGWATAMLHERGIQGVRVLVGLLSLAKQHETPVIEKACQIAGQRQVYRLRIIRTLVKHHLPAQGEFDFLQEDPIIRPLAEYQQVVQAHIQDVWRPNIPPCQSEDNGYPRCQSEDEYSTENAHAFHVSMEPSTGPQRGR